MIKNILFDFDGVLAESVEVKTNAFRKMYEKYGEKIATQVAEHHQNNGGMSRFEKFKIYHGEWLGHTITEDLIKKLSAEFSNIVIDEVINCPEVPGTKEFLDSYSNTLKFWVITGTPTDEIKLILEKRKMIHYFVDVFGSPTGKVEWVGEILEKWKLKPEETIFVGDALSDYKAASAHNLKFILRATNENKNLFNDYAGPIINDLYDLQKLI
jgi:phosphoglycolate phosphatase-like HAD superfamily hydrolase